MSGVTSTSRAASAAALLVAAVAGAGCATTYSEHLDAARQAVDAGDYPAAIAELNDVLDVDSEEELPDDWGSNTSLALLERASLLQAEGRWELSARDFMAADERLERLDMRPNAAGKTASWLLSEEAKIYKAPPTERIALNSLNILNFLMLGDLSGARVEAKRMTVMREYLQDVQPDAPLPAFASYLAGFVFEQLGEAGEALLYYDEALRSRDLETLARPIGRLSRRGYLGEATRGFLERHGDVAPPPDDDDTRGELLVFVGLGRVPYKIPERIPIGAAIGLAGGHVTGDLRILERTALKVVSFGRLVPSGTRAKTARLTVDGGEVEPEEAADLEALRFDEWEVLKPRIVGAAITRLVARAAAAEGARAAGKKHSEGLGAILALAGEGALLAADKPDTRSWNFLPERVLLARERVPAGRHEVRLRVPEVGVEVTMPVDVPAGGYGLAVVPVLR